MPETPDVDRRTVLRSVGTVATAGVLAGCGGDRVSGTGGGTPSDGGGSGGGDGGSGDGDSGGQEGSSGDGSSGAGDGDGGGGDGGSASGDGGDTPTTSEGSDGGVQAPREVTKWLSNADNFDGVTDETGSDTVRIKVGTDANGGNFGFGPPAVRIDPGTTVVWEWTGNGGAHNVVATNGNFESELTSDKGHTFEQTFDSSGIVRYFCRPHKALGMKGALIVRGGDGSSGDKSGGDGDASDGTPTPSGETPTPSGGDGESGDGSTGDAPSDVTQWLSDAGNYDGVVDMTGKSPVVVKVGAKANGGAFGFAPPAIRIDAGTRVIWEWTGDGGSHNVVDKDGSFESELKSDDGATYQRRFDSAGTVLYYCAPHKALGMKGALIVE